MPSDVAIDTTVLDRELSGLDQLELAGAPRVSLGRRAWTATWPKVLALGIGIGIWQLVVWSGWKEDYVLAGPGEAFSDLWGMIKDGTMGDAVRITLVRAAKGFALAVLIGMVVGSLVARIGLLRAAFGSFITGLQTMPSIAWFPLAILLFKLGDGAIMFVVVLGAAPSVANGLISGVDHIPPILLRASKVLGARGVSAFRHVILPASLPAFVGGLKQGWAFAWRSLMAGELIANTPGKRSVGFLLDQNRQLADSSGLLATMIVILVIGIVVDSLIFGTLDRAIRRRWGLIDPAL